MRPGENKPSGSVRHSAFSVPQALGISALLNATSIQGPQHQQNSSTCAGQQQQLVPASLETLAVQTHGQSRDVEMVSVAKSVMQSSGTGCLDIVELLTASTRSRGPDIFFGLLACPVRMQGLEHSQA